MTALSRDLQQEDSDMRTRCEVLLITGMKSKYVGDTEAIHREMRPGLCSIIKAGKIFL